MTPEQCNLLSTAMRVRANELARFADLLDVSTTQCSCCSSVRYNNWPQKQMHDQMIGAMQRLENIANTLSRRADDPQFIGVQP
jgi:hypothetical protein